MKTLRIAACRSRWGKGGRAPFSVIEILIEIGVRGYLNRFAYL
jgi:hypothetical protein